MAESMFDALLKRPRRMGAGDGELSLLQKFAPIITGKPEDYAKPDFYKGAGKALAFDVLGAPGDLGYLLGNAKGIQESVADNWGEGRPLFENVGESMGDPRDYGVTSDALAERAGTPFTDEQTRGRIVGDMVSPVGMIRALQGLRRMEGNLPPAPEREPALGEVFRGQRGAVGPVDPLDGEALPLDRLEVDYEAQPSVDEFIGNLLDEGTSQTGIEAGGASTNKLPRGRGKALKDEQIKAKKAESLLEKWRAMSPVQQAAHAASMPKTKGKPPTVDRMKFKYEDDAKQARKNVQGIENLRTVRPTVDNPLRAAYPGIYKNPSRLAAEANRMVAPEDPALKELFGVTRADLYGMLQDRVGGQAQTIKRPKTGRIPTSPQLESIMSEANTNRLLEGISTARREAPALVEGMAPWYIMDPMYRRQVELVGEEEATRLFNQMNTLTGMSSPGSGVDAELHRGTAANYLAEQGRFSDFVDKVGIPFDKRGPDFPSDIIDVPGHAYHATAHTKPMVNYLEPEYHGDRAVEMGSVKVPSYIEAGGVPGVEGIPFQTKTPIGDAHFSRSVGLADVRKSGDWGASITGPELRGLEDWWQKDIAEPSGFEAVPAQAINWGLYAPQTGVETLIGAGKLELLARRIMDKARRTGENPYDLRDRVLKGQAFATAAGAGVLGAGSILNETEVQALDWLLEDMENET